MIEKYPIVKEKNYLDNIFKIIVSYYDDKLFICKLDLLNCTTSLIFTSETEFRPNANVCLFKVLDFLTDDEWMKRKISNKYSLSLIFYCKEEIMPVKDNIVEFLNRLKEDSVTEVREVCIQTLKFIEGSEAGAANERDKRISNKNKKIVQENINYNDNQNKNKKVIPKDIKNINKSANINNKMKNDENKKRDRREMNSTSKKYENNNENSGMISDD